MWFKVIRCVLFIRNYFKPKIVGKIINLNLYLLIFIWFERVKNGDYVYTYITLILVISIIGKIVGFRFIFFVETAILTKNIQGITYYFPAYHMIQEFISGKGHIKWQIIFFYIKLINLINFEALNCNKLIYDL